MRFALAIILTLLLTTAAIAQVTVPLGNVTVTPPPPASFTQQVTQPVDVTVSLNGVQYRVTGPLAGTLTFTLVSGTTGGTGGTTAATITAVLNPALQPVQTAASGTNLVIQGTGLGQFGAATIAGIAAQTVTWTPTQVTIKVPVVPASSSGIGSIVLTPGGQTAVTASGTFTITAGTAELPPPGPVTGVPTWESPVIATSGSSERPGFIPLEPGTVLAAPADDWLAAYLPAIVPEPVPAPDFKPTALVYNATTADGKMTINGRTLGATGRVEVDQQAVPVLSWTPDQVIVLLISMDIVPVDHALVLIWQGLGDYYYGTVPINGAPVEG